MTKTDTPLDAKSNIDPTGKGHRDLLTVQDVARLLKVSISQVYALIQSKKLGHYRITTRQVGGIRVSTKQLDAYLAACEQAREDSVSEEPSVPREQSEFTFLPPSS